MENKEWSEMEEPCICNCGEPFDLQDGYKSLNSNNVLCWDCHKKEQDDADAKEEIQNELETIGNALLDIDYAIKRLSELGHQYTSEVESFRIKAIVALEEMKKSANDQADVFKVQQWETSELCSRAMAQAYEYSIERLKNIK
jgi:hypothetical protein